MTGLLTIGAVVAGCSGSRTAPGAIASPRAIARTAPSSDEAATSAIAPGAGTNTPCKVGDRKRAADGCNSWLCTSDPAKGIGWNQITMMSCGQPRRLLADGGTELLLGIELSDGGTELYVQRLPDGGTEQWLRRLADGGMQPGYLLLRDGGTQPWQ